MSSKPPSPRHMLAAVGVAAVAAACGGNDVASTTAAASPTLNPSASATRASKTACELATADEVKGLIGQEVTRQPAFAAPSGIIIDNCVYGNSAGASVVIGLNSRPGFGTAMIKAALSHGAQPIAGMGDRAVLSHQGGALAINAVKSDVLVSLSVSGASVSEEAAAEAFVRTLLARV